MKAQEIKNITRNSKSVQIVDEKNILLYRIMCTLFLNDK